MKLVKCCMLATVCASSFILSACATNRPTGTAKKEVETTQVVTVESIDVPNRLVVVRTPSNDLVTVYVSESHKDFPMASVGDKVRISYSQSIAVSLAKPGEASKDMQLTRETSEPAKGRPTGSASAELSATVKIESVNKNGSVVMFTGPRGRRAIDVKDPAMRDFARKLKPGDNVDVTYKEAVAIKLEKVKK